MFPRRKTRKVVIGDQSHGFVGIGGDAPVAVQTMTSGYTWEIDKCVAEIQKLAAAGADIVRVAVPERKDTAALKEILPQGAVSRSSRTCIFIFSGPWKPSKPASTRFG